MDKNELLKLLKTGSVTLGDNTETLDERIRGMSEKDIKEAVVEFVYSKTFKRNS